MTEEKKMKKWAEVLNGLAMILLVFLLAGVLIYALSICEKTENKDVELKNKQIEFMNYIMKNDKEVIIVDK